MTAFINADEASPGGAGDGGGREKGGARAAWWARALGSGEGDQRTQTRKLSGKKLVPLKFGSCGQPAELLVVLL